MTITLFGATGFTGKLTAHALSRAGLPFRLAGRSPQKLAELSEELPGRPEWLAADAAVPATLPLLFKDTRLLINLAGPFTDLGEKVAAQAALCGVDYLDVTNELGYAYRLRAYAEMAQRSGAALLPACGFEVALADCAAHLLGETLGEPLDEVNVVYQLSGPGASRGTRLSAVRSLATSWITYRDGDWSGQIPGGRLRGFEWAGKKHAALCFPSCESVTIPAHVSTRRVDVWLANIRGARFWAPLGIPLFARLSRSILRGWILSLAANGSLPTAGAMDGSGAFTIFVTARRGSRQAELRLEGRDPYGLTAEIVAYAAGRLTAPGYERRGLLAPAQAFDPREFLDFAAAHWGLTIQR